MVVNATKMKCLHLLVVFVFTIASASAEEDEPLYGQETKLLSTLMSDYDRRVLPRPDKNTPVNVKFGIHLQAIYELDEVKHTLRTVVWGNYDWTDPRLRWNPDEYGGIESIRLPPSTIWTPDVIPYNGVGNDGGVTDHSSVVVYSSGRSSCVPVWNMESTCSLDLRHFPYDTQTCVLKFGSWTYNGQNINLTSSWDKVDTSSYQEHAEWKLKSRTAKRNVAVYECCPEPYMDITFILELERRPGYHVYIYVLPPVFLGILAPFIFLQPTVGPHRLLHGGTVILALAILLGTFDLVTSRGFGEIPLLAIFHIGAFIISILVTLLASFVSWIASKSKSQQRPHRILSTCTGSMLAKLVCICDGGDGDDGEVMVDGESLEMTEKPSNKQTLSGEWGRIARVLDRFFFLVFLIMIILMAIVLHNKL